MYIVFFFKQKAAYEMRISDWSSDVCSSDLQRRTELGIEEMRDVEGAGFVKLHHLGRDVARLLETDVADAGGFVSLDGLAGEEAVDDRAALAADQVEGN